MTVWMIRNKGTGEFLKGESNVKSWAKEGRIYLSKGTAKNSIAHTFSYRYIENPEPGQPRYIRTQLDKGICEIVPFDLVPSTDISLLLE